MEKAFNFMIGMGLAAGLSLLVWLYVAIRADRLEALERGG